MLRRRVFLPGLCLAFAACDNAFHGRSVASSLPPLSFQVEFDDGSSQRTYLETDPVTLVLWVPVAGYRGLLPGGGVVDPAFFEFRTNPGLGGAAPTFDQAAALVAQGLVLVGAESAGRVPLTVTLDPNGPLPVPAGAILFSVQVIDDLGRSSGDVQVRATVLAVDRPTVVPSLEIPPVGTTPTGLPLPTNGAGDAFIGQDLPFVLAFAAVPNPVSGAGFSKLLGGSPLDPAYLQVIADEDLGDPNTGGYAAGTNLAPLFGAVLDITPDPATGGFDTGMLIVQDDPLAPPLGKVTFLVTIIDDDGAASTPQAIALQVDPAVSLAADLVPLFQLDCSGDFCHGPVFPSFGLRLDSTAFVQSTAVWVDAFETDENTSCAPWRIEPYSDTTSYMIHKLAGTQFDGCVGGVGNQMPTGKPPWDAGRMTLITDWIRQGAADN